MSFFCMKMIGFAFIILHVIVQGIAGFSNYSANEYQEFVMPNSSPNKTLYCPVDPCINRIESAESCCLCRGLTEWDYHNLSLGELSIRLFSNDTFHGEVVNYGYMKKLYRLKYEGHFLMSFPEKMCEFSELVIMILTNNWITEVGNISCLRILDTLNVSGNRIRELKADTFKFNKNLRILDVSHNMLATLEPGFMSQLALPTIILHHNYLRFFDVSNLIFIERPFCEIDVSNNLVLVHTITNAQNFTIEGNKTYGPGFVNFQHNILRTVSDFIQKIGLKRLGDAWKLWHFGFDIRNNPIVCDCKMVPFMEMFNMVLKMIDRDYFNIICFDPPNMNGVSLYNLTKTGKWENFTCPLKEIDNCPDGCSCYYKLNSRKYNYKRTVKTVIVNCTSVGLDDLPRRIPQGDRYLLYFSNNFISDIIPKRYFEKTEKLLISYNRLIKIDSKAVRYMINIRKIILTGNRGLTEIPKRLRLINPCKIKLPILYLKCTCKNIWMKDWINGNKMDLKKRNCNKDRVFCKTKDKTIPMSRFDAKVLFCDFYLDTYARNILIMTVSLMFVLIVATVSISCLYYEIIILLRKGQIMCKQRSLPRRYHEFDVFVSSDEQRADIRKWIMTTLIPMLQREGIRVYVPMISLPLGAIRSEETERIIRKCHTFLVILSDGYFEDGSIWTSFEWKAVWKRFYSTQNLDIVLVNFDLLDKADISDRPTKALLNLGYAIEFHNQSGDIHEKIKRRIRRSEFKETSRGRFRYKQNLDEEWELVKMNECTPLLLDEN